MMRLVDDDTPRRALAIDDFRSPFGHATNAADARNAPRFTYAA